MKIIENEINLFELYATIAAEFFRDILALDNNGFYTEESTLSDFSFSGNLPTGFTDNLSLNQAYEKWDAFILAKIKAKYNWAPCTTRITMLKLFYELEQLTNTKNNIH